MSLTVGSLFSGIGGLDLGLERAGMQVVWQAEVDPYCCRVLAKHWPTVPNLGDVTQVDWSSVERVDVLAGGYPCQPFSLAGRREGENDPRHLWPYMLDAIRVLRPRYALLENVPGHLALGFGRVLGDLAEIGYDAEWDCVPAAAVGAPHLRDRVFVVAHPHSAELRVEPVSVFGSSGPAVARVDGPALDVAHTHRAGCTQLQGREAQPERSGRRTAGGAGWWSPKSELRRMVDGIPPQLDRGLNDANATESGPAEDVLALRRINGTQDDERPARGPSRVHAAEVLRPNMHGRSDADRQPISDVLEAFQEAVVRVLRDHRPSAGAPPGRGPVEQLAGELADVLRAVSHPMALGPRQDVEAELTGYLHRLRQACVSAGALRHASDSLQAAWQSLSGEAQAWALMGARLGPWHAEWPGVGRVETGVPSRVDRLRGLGNAVVPQVAEWIGRRLTAACLVEENPQ